MYIYKYDMSYNVNLVPNVAPAGTVMQYASLIGATDPSGWAICDGVSRSNATGQYNNILTTLLGNIASANTTILNAPLNPIGSLPQNITFFRSQISSNGQVIALLQYGSGPLYLSLNGGQGWTAITVTGTGWGVAMSSSGSNIAYTFETGIKLSTNYGLSFNTISVPGYPGTSNAYPDIVMSGDGTIILLPSATTTKLYYSGNTGTTWSSIYTLSSGNFSAIAMSTNGNVFAFSSNATNSFIVYISTSYGTNWSATLPSGSATTADSFITIAMSANGQYIIAAGSGSRVYLSSSTGNFWTTIGGAGYGSLTTATGRWTSFSVSNTGQYMLIFANYTTFYASSNFGNFWSEPTIPGIQVPDLYCSSSMSQNGIVVFASYLMNTVYASSNYGFNWYEMSKEATSPTFLPISSTGFGAPDTIGWGNVVSMSETGQIMAASSNNTTYQGVYVSTNSGNNWKRTNGGSLGTTVGVNSISMTFNGSVMVACSNNLMHISTNYGSNWRQLTAPVLNYNLCYISGNGNVIVGITFYSGTSAALSSDGGNTFSTRTIAQGGGGISMNSNGSVIIMNNNFSTNSGTTWRSVFGGQTRGFSLSNDGTKILVGDWYNEGGLYLSTNSGTNFTTSPGGLNIIAYSVSMSGDGKFMVAVDNTSSIYLSTNTGNNWLNLANYTSIPSSIVSICMSNDGTKLLAAAPNGELFVSNQAFSTANYFSSFTPMNIANTTTIDGTTLKSIMKY
jgi:hypothetical protein